MAGRKTESKKKAAPSSDALDQMRRMRAIRSRARTSPLATIGDRLTEIEMIAKGDAKPADFRRKTLSIKQIRERHDRIGKKPKAERKESGGHDRKQADDAGHDREA